MSYDIESIRMDAWGGWHKEHEGDGFTKVTNIKSPITLRTSCTWSRYVFDGGNNLLDEPRIIQKLTEQLAEKIVKERLVSYYKHFDPKEYQDRIEAEITISPPGQRLVHVEDECFKVNGELFTEEEIIAAIKNTYPDRLI